MRPTPRTAPRGAATKGRTAPRRSQEKGKVIPVDTEHWKTKDLEISENALAILKKRYLKKDERGEAIEEPMDMFRRVAGNIAEAEFIFADQTGMPVTPLAEARNGRPRTLKGVTMKLMTGHGPLYVTMNDDELGARECFIVLGKPGGTAAAFSDALGRIISLAETHGADPAEVVKQLRGIQDGHSAGLGENAVLSVPDGVAKAMAEHYLSGGATTGGQPLLPIIGACPDCGSELARESGCVVCKSPRCGFSRCS